MCFWNKEFFLLLLLLLFFSFWEKDTNKREASENLLWSAKRIRVKTVLLCMQRQPGLESNWVKDHMEGLHSNTFLIFFHIPWKDGDNVQCSWELMPSISWWFLWKTKGKVFCCGRTVMVTYDALGFGEKNTTAFCKCIFWRLM